MSWNKSGKPVHFTIQSGSWFCVLLLLNVSACDGSMFGATDEDPSNNELTGNQVCQSPADCGAFSLPDNCANGKWNCIANQCQAECENGSNTGQACQVAADCGAFSLPENCANGNWNCTGNKCQAACGGSDGTGCISDRVVPPTNASCSCECVDCNCTGFNCTCDLNCYVSNDCLIGTDADGNPVTNDSTLGTCDLSCKPEDDLSEDMGCTASNCELQPNTTTVSLEVEPGSPGTKEMDMNREIKDVSVLFVIDNSPSMADDQMATACAMDSYFAEASANSASYQTGVITTDMLGYEPGTTVTYDDSGNLVQPPSLVGLNGSCDAVLQCTCGTGVTPSADDIQVCNFKNPGSWIETNTADGQKQLKQEVVQGDHGSRYEGGLEQAFQFFAAMEKNGTFASSGPYEVVVISDENADADDFLCPFNAVDRNTTGIPNFNPPTPQNLDSTCQSDLTAFYLYYFTSRNIMVHGLLYTTDCAHESIEEIGEIYLAVIQATGGAWASICHCENYEDFFTHVGQSTSTLSTSLCFNGENVDPNTLIVTYTEGGASQEVPRSDNEGWSFDAGTSCIVFHGTWQSRYGSYHVEYQDPNASAPTPDSATACLAQGIDPLINTIAVTCGGVPVPQSSTEGWTYDSATHCFTFHGSFATSAASCEISYF
jgi:hypothetical protein